MRPAVWIHNSRAVPGRLRRKHAVVLDHLAVDVARADARWRREGRVCPAGAVPAIATGVAPEMVMLLGLARRTARKSRKHHYFTGRWGAQSLWPDTPNTDMNSAGSTPPL